MSEQTSAQPLVDLIRAQSDPGSPIVRAGLERVVRAWTDGVYEVDEALRLGTVATMVQAVVAAQYRGLPALVVVGDGLPLDSALDLVLAAAGVFAAAARLGHPRAWEYAATAAQLRAAVGDVQ